jgi:hypothetical protein
VTGSINYQKKRKILHMNNKFIDCNINFIFFSNRPTNPMELYNPLNFHSIGYGGEDILEPNSKNVLTLAVHASNSGESWEVGEKPWDYMDAYAKSVDYGPVP